MRQTIEEQLTEQVHIEEFLDLLGWSLKRQGRYYRGCCPLHGGDNPSAFSYHVGKNRFYCSTRCGSVGNFITTYAKAKHISREKALIELAKWKKIPLKGKKKFTDLPKIREKKVEVELPKTIVQLPLVRAFEKKGLQPLTPNDRFNQIVIDRFSIQQANEGRYHNRIVFPIYDHLGRWVGNNGRWIGEDYTHENTKYLYSPEPFESKYILYGAHLSWDSPYWILHEGVTDVTRAYEHGYEANAILGSFLSEEQVEIMRQHPKPILLGFDGDEAGKKATIQAIQLLFSKHLMDVSVMEFQNGQDPGGSTKEAYDHAYLHRIPAMEYMKKQMFG